jgi:hypothetical protein
MTLPLCRVDALQLAGFAVWSLLRTSHVRRQICSPIHGDPVSVEVVIQTSARSLSCNPS